MTEFSFNLSEIKLALKRKGLNYKLNHSNPEDCSQEILTFSDVARGTKLKGKVVRFFNEGEMYHWRQLYHENIAPLLDVLSIRDDLKVFLTADLEMKLKNIIHEEDFVYDLKCFDRKREYARGIFCGLSYLHGKSLCLMNLSDENIYICKTYDRAVITNFSTLVCSGRTTKAGLKVCKLYRAPETEKGEFDTMTAEIWASGTLMLDVFLAHTVPWAVIDYKPQRILEIVDKISMEMLQAASAGSILTTVDLAKFKAFLKCFFRENPCMRITARYASIASFLKPKFENSTRILPTRRIPCSDIKCKSKEHFIPCCLPEPPAFSSGLENMKQNSFATNNLCSHCLTLNYFESERKSNNLLLDLESPRRFIPYSIADSPNLSKSDERHFCLSNIRNPPDTLLSYKVEKPNQKAGELIFVGCENDNRNTGMLLRQKETSKSCQEMVHRTNMLPEYSYLFRQSKSLSFIKPIADDSESDVSFPMYRSRNDSYSSIKSLPLQKSNSNNRQKCDFCLNRLFGENESSEEAMVHQGEVTHKASVESNARDRKYSQNLENVSFHGTFKQDVEETGKLSKDTTRNLCNQPDIQRITENILFLRKCQISLQEHLRFFSNDKFMQKQRSLINDYQLLLSHEKNRLYEILKTKYALNIDEIIRMISFISSRSRYRKTCSRTRLSQSTFDSSHELPAFKFVKYTGHNNARIPDTNCTGRKFQDDSTALSGRSERTYSYRRAIEQSENRSDADRIRIPSDTENKSEDKLIEKDTWPEEADHEQKKIPNAKADAEKYSTKVKKTKIGKEKNDHRNAGWRRFFFSWCPWRKFEEPIPLTDDLCETCKVNHKAMRTIDSRTFE